MFSRSIYSEIREEMKKDNKRRNDNRLLLLILILTSPFIVFYLVQKPYEYIPDLNNLPDPIQTTTKWWTTINVNWETVHIDYLAEYDIQWRVLAIREYWEIFANNKILNKIWPRDIVLWWGIMSDEQNMEKFIWSEFIDRMVQPHIKREYSTWLNENWGRDNLKGKWSNNHPIRSNQKIRLYLKKIKIWDVIRIKWYLVKVYPENGSRKRWPSSLVRDDSWDGACEIIYVTEISRLKER